MEMMMTMMTMTTRTRVMPKVARKTMKRMMRTASRMRTAARKEGTRGLMAPLHPTKTPNMIKKSIQMI